MKNNKIEKIMEGEYRYKDCVITKQEHPMLSGKYLVFKNNDNQDIIGRSYTLTEAKELIDLTN